MNLKNKIAKLIKIADYLDKQDMAEDADFIDSLLENEINDTEIDIEIPSDEYDQIQEISDALSKSLGNNKQIFDTPPLHQQDIANLHASGLLTFKEMKMPLMIVESPNKINKIKKALPNDFVLMASFGHIMDLEKKNMGIDLNKFETVYKINDDKKEVVKKIKEEAEKHEIIYVATDPDREGEGISHNILSILPKKGKKIIRVAFHELSKSAILNAIKNPVGFNEDLYFAQQARRMTDRIVGFKVSPVMWAKGMKNTSAGRVQSATLKWIVDREKEIRAFKTEEYWSILANLVSGFQAEFFGVNNKKLIPKSQQETDQIIKDLSSDLTVTQYDSKSRARSPYPPFDTASLQQEASTRFNWTSQRTMSTAQKIFEYGLITYHRSDSVRIEPAKIDDIRDRIEAKFGKQFVAPSPRIFKNEDSAQDAHEAIRPTFEAVPSSITVDEKKLLDLVTDRFMASQMADAVFDQTKIELTAQGKKDSYLFKAAGSILQFEGFLKVYPNSSQDVILPKLTVGDVLPVTSYAPGQHFTKPPGRYTDASFVGKMKKEGVGRPSTYATVTETLIEHGYINRDNKNLKPTEIGIMVSDYLSAFFKDITDTQFTAKLETELDQIANGKITKESVMQHFMQNLEQELETAKKGESGGIFKTDIDCPSCKNGNKMVRKISKHKEVFLGCEKYPECGHVMNFDEDGNVTESEEETSKPCPECGSKIVERNGKFGKFYSCSSYPACNWTGNVDKDGNVVSKSKVVKETTEIDCPACSSKMIKREGKFGPWLGCSNYPKCKHTMKLDDKGKPITAAAKPTSKSTGEKCPKCKKGDLLEREGKFGKFKGCSEFRNGCKYISKDK